MAMKTTMSELKYHSELVAGGGPSSTAYVSSVPQGTGNNERVGDRINMAALRFRSQYVMTSGTQCSVTWSLVLDRQSNQAITLDVDDLYDTGLGAGQIIYSVQRPETYERYVVLYESPVFTLTGTAAAPGSAYAHFEDELIEVNYQTQLAPDFVPVDPFPYPAFSNALFIVHRMSGNNASGIGIATLYYTE